MKSTQRPSAATLALLALSLATTSVLAQASRPQPEQRGGAPNGDTPYIVVATFHSPDRVLGATMADEVRKRLQSERSTKELYVVPKINIDHTLEASGFRTDSALSVSDVYELAKALRGDQVLDGSVTKTASGVHVEPRLLMRIGKEMVTQPLPALDAHDAGDAAKQIERSLTDASKALPSYRLCTSALRAAKYDDAAKAARVGLEAYSNSSFSRLCLLSAFSSQKAPADSIIGVAKQIIASDSTSMIAWANLGDAYEQKHDTANMISAYLAVYRLDPSNPAIAKTIVSIIVKFGSPNQALEILDTLLAQNPGDGDLLRAKWLVLSKSGDFKKAFAAGEEYGKGDTARADLDYFRWQIRNAQLDSNTAVAQALTEQAARKFANDADLQLLLAQGYRKAGLAAIAAGSAPAGRQQLTQALAAARRASQIDAKNTRTTLLVMYIQNDLGQPDSAMATAQQAIASGQSRDSIGQALLANVGPALKIAQDTKTRADWETALKAAQTVDAIAPSPQSKFYTGFAAFNVGADALTNVQALQTKSGKDDRAKACSELKVVEDMFATTSIAMPAGGVVDKATANQILASVTTYSAYIPQFKTALKCK